MPQPLLPPNPDQWDLRASPDATGLQVRKVPPDLRGPWAHRARRASPASPAPRASPGAMVLRDLPARLDLLAPRRHAPWPRDSLALRVRLGLKAPWGLPVPKVRKVWRDIRALRGLKASLAHVESLARPAPQVRQDLPDLLGR